MLFRSPVSMNMIRCHHGNIRAYGVERGNCNLENNTVLPEGIETLEHRECALAFRKTGEGPAVLFIQGVAVHGDGWQPQMVELSTNYTCLSFDNRGIGNSQPLGVKKLTVQQMAEDALALIDAQAWNKCHIVGHSLGGHIATALALTAPERVRSLALFCTSARGKDMPPITLQFLWTSLRSQIGPKPNRRRAFLEMIMPIKMRESEDLDEWANKMAKIFGHDLAEAPSVLHKQVSAYRSHDATSRLRELGSIPTIVASGSEDPVGPPRLGQALAEGIPNSEFHLLDGASHGMTVTHAEEINKLLADHFSKTSTQ